MFDVNNPKVVTDKIQSPRIYNRKERRKSAFVMVNERGWFGRWNKLLKQIDFENIPLEFAPIYKHETITLMFKIDVVKSIKVVKVVRNKQGKREFSI